MNPSRNFIKTGKKIIGIGRNYLDHVKELNNQIPKHPFFFLKPTTSYLSNHQSIQIPKGILCHHEVELGYTLAIDLTARNLQEEIKSKSLPWSSVKGFDTFCPVGRWIPFDEIQDPHDLNLWLKVNGELKQSSSTNQMIFKIPDLIRYCSNIMTLEEGDLILTGTPAGVGAIKPGDLVEAGLVQSNVLIDRLNHDVIQRTDGFVYEPNRI
ncbi:hypothetical protein DFH28DRAFT_225033 [Melampsora americana]|nr:hypothetical protein DFH28DRAFT_225033 [Melampsora americana]